MKTLAYLQQAVLTPSTIAKHESESMNPDAARRSQPFLVISHRFGLQAVGYGRGDENSLDLLAHALQSGSRAVEFDVWKIEDDQEHSEFVVFHGPDLKPGTNGEGKLPNVCRFYLSHLVTKHGSKIPTLGEVLDKLPADMQLVNIELKGSTGGTELALYLKNLHEAGKLPFMRNIMISAFDHRMLFDFLLTWNVPKIGLLYSSIDLRMVLYAKTLGAYSLNMDDSVVEPSFVHEAKYHGLKVFVWTVNDLERARELARMGVDGIFSDRLDLSGSDITE